MKILWLRPTKPENVSVGRQRVAEVLRDRGEEVSIVNASGKDAIVAAYKGLSGDYDIIVGTVRMGLYVGYIISRLTRTPILADITDPLTQIDDLPFPIYLAIKKMELNIIDRSEGRVFLYESSYQRSLDRGTQGTKLNNGVEYEKFANPDSEVIDEVNRKFGKWTEKGEKTAVYIGGLEPIYHIEEILQAVEFLPDWNFLFVGDGSLSEDVVSASKRNENVFFPGSVRYDLIPGILACADVGFCLVDAEQPLKVLEYGAAGLPTLAIPGELQGKLPEDALLYISPDVEAIVEGLKRLDSSPELHESFAERLQEVSRDYSWEQIGQQYHEILTRICN